VFRTERIFKVDPFSIGILRLKCLLNGERSSPASISRQGFANKSLQSGPNFKVKLLWHFALVA
jgi:hypothetical protein